MLIRRVLSDLNGISNQDLKNLSAFEQQFFNLVKQCSFTSNNGFPVMDTYVVYKDKEKKEIDKMQLYMYLAGYKQEDISIEFNEATRKLSVSGNVKDKQYFPNGENIERVTQNASARKFHVNYRIPDYDVSNASMSDGVLVIDFTPSSLKNTKKIEINQTWLF